MHITKQQLKDIIKLFGAPEPRDYQEELLEAFRKAVNDGNIDQMKILLLDWHRRAGKDRISFMLQCVYACLVPGAHYYIFPTKAACIENVFEGVDGDKPWLNFIPEVFIDKINRSRFFVKFKNGSIMRFKGSDKDQIQNTRGFSASSIVISEAAYHSEGIWPVISPALQERKGLLILNSTHNGKTWFYKLQKSYEIKRPKSVYYCKKVTVDDTKLLSDEQLKEERERCLQIYGDDTLFKQEFYCSVEAGALGSIYHNEIVRAEDEKRIGNYEYDNQYPVYTFWDLGRDGTAIWFVQPVGNKHYFIDYEEKVDSSMETYVNILKSKPYKYYEHHLPHDAMNKDVKDENNKSDILENLLKINGMCSNIVIAEKVTNKNDVIMSVRNVFRNAVFNKEKCAIGLEHLQEYHRSFDAKRRIYSDKPVHDRHSHAADAFGIWGISFYNIKSHTPKNLFEETFYNNDDNLQADLWEWKL